MKVYLREINNRVNNTVYATGKRKTLREAEFPRMEKSFYNWLAPSYVKQNKMPINGLMLKAKVLEILDQNKENDWGFLSSY